MGKTVCSPKDTYIYPNSYTYMVVSQNKGTQIYRPPNTIVLIMHPELCISVGPGAGKVPGRSMMSRLAASCVHWSTDFVGYMSYNVLQVHVKHYSSCSLKLVCMHLSIICQGISIPERHGFAYLIPTGSKHPCEHT